MGSAKSLILITVDCLRADRIGAGYAATPFLTSMGAESIVANAIVTGSPTYYSFPAIMASRYPLALGRDIIGLAPGEPTLASVLLESGYATAAFLAGNPYLSRRFGYDAGFEVFRDFLQPAEDLASSVDEVRPSSRLGRFNQTLATASHKLGPVGTFYDELYFQYCQRLANSRSESFDTLRRFPSADVIVKVACEWIAANKGRPFFLWLHLMDPHSPYYPKQEALDAMGNAKMTPSRARYLNSYWNRGEATANGLKRHREEVISLYDAGIRWVDTQIANLVENLKKSDLWPNCALAVTADHGEEFLDHAGRFHPPSKLTEELIRVPFLLRVPGVDKQGRPESRSPFSLLHLPPTLLDAVNVPAPGSFRGRSHWKKLQTGQPWEQPAIVECVAGCTNPFRPEGRMNARVLAIRGARFKLVIDFASSADALFDLQSDPGEVHPLAQGGHKPVRKILLEYARKHLAESVQSRDAGHRLDARLRDLQLEWAHSNANISA